MLSGVSHAVDFRLWGLSALRHASLSPMPPARELWPRLKNGFAYRSLAFRQSSACHRQSIDPIPNSTMSDGMMGGLPGAATLRGAAAIAETHFLKSARTKKHWSQIALSIFRIPHISLRASVFGNSSSKFKISRADNVAKFSPCR